MSGEIQVDLMLRDAGSMRATADLTFETAQGPITIKGFKVVEQPGKEAWVGLPSKEYQKDGQRRFQRMVEMSKPGMKAVAEAVLAEYKKKLGRQ